MTTPDPLVQPYITSIDYDGRRYNVSCRISFDGIEYIGRLIFKDETAAESFFGLPDRGGLPGRTREEVLELARRLSPQDLVLRYRRAQAEKRRYLGLRRVTDEILSKVRYMNQVAISMKAGLLDPDGANHELALTEQQLHEIVTRLRPQAGVEG